MRSLGLVLIILLASTVLYGQTSIKGTVTDTKGRPIPGANIFILNAYDGTSSDASGNFEFVTADTGDQVLVASFIGYEKWEMRITVDSQTITVNIRLKEAVSELKAVTIAAGAFEASDEKKMVMLRPLDIVTTAGASGDIYGAIQTLPGTGVVGEKEGLFVRGGDATETKTFIDGLAVDNPYFSSVPDVPQRGRFSPFLFKGTSFSSGGYSAQYGQAMSSALILESQDLPERTITNVGLMSVGAGVGHTKRWKKSSVGIYGNYTDLRPYFAISEQNRKWDSPPRSAGGSMIFRHKTSETGMLKGFISYTWSGLTVAFPDTSDPLLLRQNNFSIDTKNIFSTFSYREIFFKHWILYAAGSFSMNEDEFSIDEFPFRRKNDLYNSRITISRTLGELSVLRFGGEFQKPTEKTSAAGFDQRFNESYSAAFAEADIYITQKLVSRTGLRIERSDILSRSNIAPRVSIAYKTGKWSQFSFAYGDFYQLPQKEFLLNYVAEDFLFEKATHYILNFQHLSDYRTFRVETYYKNYDDLSRFTMNGADNSGFGEARGVELFYRDKKTIARTDFWISYSFLDTKRLYRDFPVEAMPSFAAKHTASLVYKYFIPKLSLSPSLTYVFASGRPYYNPNNAVFLSDRTRDYHNLSLNFSYLTSIADNFSVLVFSVGNVAGTKNVFSYYYSPDGSRKMEVGPAADRVYFIGLFVNIGSQRDDSDKYN